MKRMLIMLITFALVLSLVSCSWLTSFYVANKSDKPIVVTYRYKQYKNPKPKKLSVTLKNQRNYPESVKRMIAEHFSQTNIDTIKINANWRSL